MWRGVDATVSARTSGGILNMNAQTTQTKLPYEKPSATLLELKPEERLMACGKLKGEPGDCGFTPKLS